MLSIIYAECHLWSVILLNVIAPMKQPGMHLNIQAGVSVTKEH
jgi:hypothetical protein